MKNQRSQSGVALVELLVVICILAILAIVVVFAVNGTSNTGSGGVEPKEPKEVAVTSSVEYLTPGSYSKVLVFCDDFGHRIFLPHDGSEPTVVDDPRCPGAIYTPPNSDG